MNRFPARLVPVTNRIVAIDALRGFDMFWIAGGRELLLAAIAIFRDPRSSLASSSNLSIRVGGLTAWDLIMPLFLFVVGDAMPFAFAQSTR